PRLVQPHGRDPARRHRDRGEPRSRRGGLRGRGPRRRRGCAVVSRGADRGARRSGVLAARRDALPRRPCRNPRSGTAVHGMRTAGRSRRRRRCVRLEIRAAARLGTWHSDCTGRRREDPTMTRTMTAVALLLAVAAAPATSQARFDRGNVGLPPSTPGFEPGDPPPPPPPPPPLSIQSVGVDFIEISVRPPAGRVSQLVKQAPGGAFVPFGSVTPGVNAVVRDPNLGVGKEYCYRITVLGGTAGPDQSTTRCATTDWRVGFEGAGISAAESARVLRLFDWRDTETLAEGTEDEPALYHMNVLVEGSDPLTEQGLRTMGMHVQAQPIFEQEL